MYRIYLGPFGIGKVELTYHVGKIKRGQKIKVTAEEAAAMAKLPRNWGVPEEERPVAPVVKPASIKVKVTRKKRKSKKRGG